MISAMTLPANFTHLRVHSHFSLLQAVPRLAELIAQAQADDLTAVALTDTNALYGVVPFVHACQKAQMRPVVGLTCALAPPPDHPAGVPTDPGQLVLLAMNPSGYRSLCRLASLLQGSPQREALLAQGLPWEQLRAHSEGLMGIETGRDGWLTRYLLADTRQTAVRYVSRLGAIFQENGYLSLELDRPQDQTLAGEIISLGHRFGLPAVAMHPIFYLRPEQSDTLRLLQAIHTIQPIASLPPTNPDFSPHWLSPDEMAEKFATYPEALQTVGEIVGKCGPILPDGRPIWPAISLPEAQTAEEALRQQAQAGLNGRYGVEPPPATQQRLETELTAILKQGFASFFLVVADIVRFAREQKVPVSTRGSVANSLTAYCLGITTVDPIAHGLLFERFLNPSRANLPDIDLDFCSRRRDEILIYLRQTYGAERVALVATISTMRPRSAVRETAKAFGLSEAQIKAIVARLPSRWEMEENEAGEVDFGPIVAQTEDEGERAILQAAQQIVGAPHHLSLHPGGVVITPGELTDLVPLQWSPKGFVATQFDFASLEKIGLPKIDLLGIRALTVLAEAAELIRKGYDKAFDLAQIPLNDKRTGQLLARGETVGVFQCESEGGQRTLCQLRAHSVPDLAIANAFFKPGPAMGGMAQAFIRRYRGQEAVSYLHPALEPILSHTKGVLLFQEQVLRIAHEVAHLSWEQADHLRRGMSKMNPKEMNLMRVQFIAGCQPVLTAVEAETLWEQVAAFAGYGFNQGHATAYADVSYRSAYVKAHWPAPFLCARLSEEGGFYHPAIYIAEAQRLGMSVRPPHVNFSQYAFSLTQEGKRKPAVLWMGLGQVRDLRHEAIATILAQRKKAQFTDLRDLLARVPLQSKEVLHLIQGGALDGLAESRAALLAEWEGFDRAGNILQMGFNFAPRQSIPAESAGQRLAWEQAVLGWPVSVHPLQTVTTSLDKITPLADLPKLPGQWVSIAGARLPGWTGGKSFYFSDGSNYVAVRQTKSRQESSSKDKRPSLWHAVQMNGRWQVDEWDNGWFQAEQVEPLR